MKQSYIRDQRGVAMLVELVLIVAVLSLGGLAVYQSSHRPKTVSLASTSTVNTPETSVGATPATTVGLADSAAAISEQASATDVTLSASAENSTSQLEQTDSDVSNLQGSSNANF